MHATALNMNNLGFQLFFILFALTGWSSGVLNENQRSGHSPIPHAYEFNDVTRAVDLSELKKCAGYDSFGVNPSSPTSPQDSNQVRLLESSPWIQRDTADQPSPFLPPSTQFQDHELFFCLSNGMKLGISSADDGTDKLTVIPADDESSNPFRWYLRNSRFSSVSGSYVTDVFFTGNGKKCCYVSLANNVLAFTPENCFEGVCDKTNVSDGLMFTLHAIKFVQQSNSWTGVFVMCTDTNCDNRVNTVQINGEEVQILPLVLQTNEGT